MKASKHNNNIVLLHQIDIKPGEEEMDGTILQYRGTSLTMNSTALVDSVEPAPSIARTRSSCGHPKLYRENGTDRLCAKASSPSLS